MTLRKAMEKKLSRFCDVKGVSSNLTNEEKERLYRISLEFALDATEVEKRGGKALGVNVAKSVLRNYLLALLVGNAVKHFQKKRIHPRILECGSGSGLNAIAAIAIDPKASYVGVDSSNLCIAFAKKEFERWGISERASLLNADYSKISPKGKFDLIINENLSPNLVEEPQINASNIARKFAKAGTVYVPASIKVFAETNGKRICIRLLDFRKQLPELIQFELSQGKSFRLAYDVFDFNGKCAIHQHNPKNFVDYLPVMGNPISLPGKLSTVTLDTKKRRILVE